MFKKKSTTKRSAKKKNHSVAFNPFLFHLCFTTSSAVRCNPFAHGTLPNRYACSVFYRCRQAGLVEFYFSGTQSPDWFIPHAWATPRWTPSFNGQPSKNKKKRGSSLPTLILLLKDHRSSVSHIMFHSSEPTSCHTKMTNSFKDVDHLILFWPGRADQITWPFFSGICSPCLLRDLRLPGINFDTCYN